MHLAQFLEDISKIRKSIFENFQEHFMIYFSSNAKNIIHLLMKVPSGVGLIGTDREHYTFSRRARSTVPGCMSLFIFRIIFHSVFILNIFINYQCTVG